ncbi:MAG: hypothetical protein WBB67_05855 [bacterium]
MNSEIKYKKGCCVFNATMTKDNIQKKNNDDQNNELIALDLILGEYGTIENFRKQYRNRPFYEKRMEYISGLRYRNRLKKKDKD